MEGWVVAQPRGETPAFSEAELARDLRNTLLFGGAAVVCFGAMILASGPVLQIPPVPNTLAALSGALVTFGGLIALQSGWSARRVAWSALVAYALIVSVAVHYTGGPLTPMPALYLLVVVAASFILGRRGATLIGAVSVVGYALVLLAEYAGWVDMVLIWRWQFEPGERGLLLIVNWLVVFIATLITAQLAGTLAERLRQTNAQLRESERLRDNLTQMIVHDLRNPLVALMGWLDLLQSQRMQDADGVEQLLLKNARHGGEVLLGMVSELLDISKMEAGKLRLNPQAVDLCALLRETADAMHALGEVEELDLQVVPCDAAVTVTCDRQLISRVLVNLVSNAIKHTPAGGSVTLSVHLQADEVQVRVSDTGIGISAENQARIFEKFAQVQQKGERRGTGLGLTFCKIAMEAHGGRIWVESEVGEGSTFAFTLPR